MAVARPMPDSAPVINTICAVMIMLQKSGSGAGPGAVRGLACLNGMLEKSGGLGLFFVGREVVVAAFVAAPEGVALVVVQRQVVLEAHRQVRVGREVAAEGHQVGVAAGHDVLRRLAGEAA